MDVLFYHLQRQPLETVLPSLLEKCVQRGWRVAIETPDNSRLDALDALLWTYDDQSFLAHARAGAAGDATEPILLVTDASNPNAAQVRFLIDGAAPDASADYERLVVLFDGENEDALARARVQWKDIRTRGVPATYWQQDEAGRWQKKAG